MSYRVLLVDDEPQVLLALEDALADQFSVIKAGSAEQALRLVEQDPNIAVVLSDQRMPQMKGDEFLASVGERSDATRILITGFADINAVINAVNNGRIFAYVAKPWDTEALRLTVQEGAEYFRINRALLYERQLLQDLMGSAPDAICFKDEELRFVRANQPYAALLRESDPEQLVGKRLSDFGLARRSIDSIEAEERNVLQHGHVATSLMEIADGQQRRFISMTKAPREREGRAMGLVAIGRDVSELLSAQEALRKSEERLRLTFVGSNAGLFDWDLVSGGVIYSPSFASLLGQVEGELPPTITEFTTRVHPADVQIVTQAIDAHRTTRQPFTATEFRARTGAGQYQWFQLTGQAVWDEAGTATRLVGSINDITERKVQEQHIANLTRTHAMLSAINSAIVRIQGRGALLDECCRVAVREGELRFAVVALRDSEGALRIEAEAGSAPRLMDALREAFAQETLPEAMSAALEARRPFMLANLAPSEPPSWRSVVDRVCSGMALFPLFLNGSLQGVFGLVTAQREFGDAQQIALLSDLSDNISFALTHIVQTERLDFLAYYDDLTGLPKRTLLTDRIGQQLVSCRENGRRLAVVVLDIVRFRGVNDSLGRRAGDELLALVAARIKSALRGPDTLARFDGGAFGLLLTHVDEENAVADWVERFLLREMCAPFLVSAQELKVSLKLGIALYPSDGSDADTLVANAEAAVKSAKQGVLSHSFYAPSMNERAGEKLTLEMKLSRALELDEFVLYYQPKVDLKTGQVVGLEALIRWRDPQGGLTLPGSFIPVLEETGLILDVGRWVLTQAASQYSQWRSLGLEVPRIAVNVSAIQLAQPNFAKMLEQVFEQYPLAVHGLDLEITESVLMEDMPGNMQKLAGARLRGLRVAVDDFGTGYSSLGYLNQLPIDALKIDRSFILRMTEDPRDMALVMTVISLAHSLDLKVIAEGVELSQQAQLLRLLKCDQIQGYLVSRPLPADEIVSRFASVSVFGAPSVSNTVN